MILVNEYFRIVLIVLFYLLLLFILELLQLKYYPHCSNIFSLINVVCIDYVVSDINVGNAASD